MSCLRSLAFAWAVGTCVPAAAATVDASAVTLLGSRPRWRDGKAEPTTAIVESVGVRARGIESPLADDLKVVLYGWGELGPDGLGQTTMSGDVDLAFIEGRVLDKRLSLRLGRQLVTGGVARVSALDGVAVDVAGPAGLGISLAAGRPVTPRFAPASAGDFEYDVRVSLAPRPNRWSAGASFSHVLQRGARVRQEVGLDGRYYLPYRLTLSGAAMFDIVEGRVSEVDIGPRYQLSEALELFVGYRRTAPDLLLPRTSLFSVFSDVARDEVGGGAYWAAARWLAVSADGRAILVDGQQGADATLRATVRPLPRQPTALSAQVRLFRLPANGYLQARLSANHQLPNRLRLAAELDTYYMDHPVNAEQVSMTGLGSVSWPLAESWSLAFSVLGGRTPTFQSRVEGFAKLTWHLPESHRP